MRAISHPRRQRVARGAALVVIALALIGVALQHPTAAQYVALGQSATDHLAWSAALRWYEQAAALDPALPAPFVGMARIWLWQAKLDRASAAGARAEILAPGAPGVWWLAGQIARAGHHDALARDDWEQSLLDARGTPLAATVAPALADLDLALSDARGAIDTARLCVCDAPALRHTAAAAWLNLGSPARAMRMNADERDPFVALASRWRGTPANEIALGEEDSGAGWPALALAPLEASITAFPDDGVGHALLAWARWQMGDVAGARREAALAMRLAPDAEPAVTIAAVLRARDGQAASAVSDLRAWAEHSTPTVAFWAVLAPLAEQANDPATAESAWWNLAMNASPADRPAALITLARFYLATGLGRDNGRAAWAIAAARAADPANAAAATLAARWADLNGRDDIALADLQSAVGLDPRDAMAHALLAALEWRLGDRTSARLEGAIAANLDATGATRPILAQLDANVAPGAA